MTVIFFKIKIAIIIKYQRFLAARENLRITEMHKVSFANLQLFWLTRCPVVSWKPWKSVLSVDAGVAVATLKI